MTLTTDERLSQLEVEHEIREAKYDAIMEVVKQHMQDESRRQESQERLISKVFDEIRQVNERIATYAGQTETRLREYVDDKYITKLSAMEMVNQAAKRVKEETLYAVKEGYITKDKGNDIASESKKIIYIATGIWIALTFITTFIK